MTANDNSEKSHVSIFMLQFQLTKPAKAMLLEYPQTGGFFFCIIEFRYSVSEIGIKRIVYGSEQEQNPSPACGRRCPKGG